MPKARVRLIRFEECTAGCRPKNVYFPAARVAAVEQDDAGNITILLDYAGHVRRLPIKGKDVQEVCIRIWGEECPDLPPVGDTPEETRENVFKEGDEQIKT